MLKSINDSEIKSVDFWENKDEKQELVFISERESTLSGMPDPPVFAIVEKVESTAVKSSQRTCLGSSSEEGKVESH